MIHHFVSKDSNLYRIIGRDEMVHERGYYPSKERFNVLQVQKKTLFGRKWVDVEKEEVPAFAVISTATLGYTEWKSHMLARYEAAIKEHTVMSVNPSLEID